MDTIRRTIGSAGWLAHYRIRDFYLMRIAVISNYATNLWLFRRSLLEEMVAQGHEVMACAPDFNDELKARLAALGVTCQPIELRRNGLNPLQDVAYFRRLRALLKTFGPDLTLAYAVKPVIYGSLVAWSLGVKKRFSLVTGLGYAFGGASLRQRLLNGLVNRLCRLAFVTNNRVFVQNPDDAALFVDQGLLPSSKLVVVNGSGVPLHDFEQAPLPEGPTIFLFIARLMAEKGILEFVDAARHLKSTYPHARFQILGPFPFDDIPSAVKPEQLQGWIDEGVVEYLGETDDVRPFIRNAHVFVLPSYYREGTPRSALEAMAMGRPIITTDRPGCRETVIDGENGLLVPAKDPRRLAEAMQRFIDAPERLSLASAASRRLAEDKYDVRKVNRTMLAAMGLLAMDGHEDARPAETPAGWGVGADGLTESLKASWTRLLAKEMRMPLHENDEATGDQGRGVGQAYDIVFVGSGLSSSCTLAALIEQVGAGPMGRPLRVAVVEKADHFFTGIPYGARSGTASLIITPVDEFLPSPEREAFMAWLARHQDRVMAEIEAKGGPLSQDFLVRSREAIASGDCSSFHMPRYTFGLYLREKMQARLDDAERKGQLAYRLVQGEVVDIRRDDQGYDLVLEEGARIRSRLVVLALGTPPNRSLFDPAALSASKACLVEDPYLPDMEATLERIQQSLTEPGAGGERHVLLVGANATSLEMLYNLNNLPSLRERSLHFHILAPLGKLPDRFRQIETPRLETVHLNALEGQADLTAAAILEAVKADLAVAKEQSLGIADTLPMISKVVGKLVQELALEEKKTFVRHAGIEIGRLQRRAGDEYSNIADDLQRQGRLKVVAGRFTGFAEHEADGVRVLYEAGPIGERQTLAAPIDVVVNCTGSAGMSRPNVSPLIEALLASGLCRANESGAGFAVNHRMEAAEDLFVIGPLLAGNVVGDLSIWHVEHCGRIMEFSKTLARSLHDDLLEAA